MKSNSFPQASTWAVSLNGLLNPGTGFPAALLSKPDYLDKVLKNRSGKITEDINCFQIYVVNDILL